MQPKPCVWPSVFRLTQQTSVVCVCVWDALLMRTSACLTVASCSRLLGASSSATTCVTTRCLCSRCRMALSACSRASSWIGATTVRPTPTPSRRPLPTCPSTLCCGGSGRAIASATHRCVCCNSARSCHAWGLGNTRGTLRTACLAVRAVQQSVNTFCVFFSGDRSVCACLWAHLPESL